MEPPKKVVLGLDPNLDPKHKTPKKKSKNPTYLVSVIDLM
jgi:hypothetical protein